MDESIYKEFQKAISSKDLDKVKIILSSEDIDVNRPWKDFRGKCSSFLHLSSSVGIIRELINNGARINDEDEYNLTPLHYAVTNKKGIKVIGELINHGANVNSHHDGLTPLAYAVLLGDSDVIVLLVRNKADFNIPVNSPYFRYLSPFGVVINDDRRTAKLIIKHTIFLRGHDWEKFIDLMQYVRSAHFPECYKYSDVYIKEIKAMDKFFGNTRFSLYEYLKKCTGGYVKPFYPSSKAILDEVITRCRFYSDIISPTIYIGYERGILLNEYRNLHLNFKKTETEEIVLDTYSMSNIAEYLSNEDLLNFLKTFDVDVPLTELTKPLPIEKPKKSRKRKIGNSIN